MRDWIIGTLGGAALVGFFLLVAKTTIPIMEAIWNNMK